MEPLVSVICLCYNHEKYLIEALNSVLNQTYPHLEVIVVDDFSTDASASLLKEYADKHPELLLILHQINTGNCRAFNEALALSTGEFIIDFATDDVMLPTKIADQVNTFAQLDETYGVVYTDAELINDASTAIGYFYQRNKSGRITSRTPSGYVFTDILSYAFLCPPTLMFRRALLTELNGYDETLAYEDFDVWVRSGQRWQYYFLNKVLMKRRLHTASLSHQLYKPGDKQLQSTVKICRKAQQLVRTEAEKKALIIRVKSEIRQAFSTGNFSETGKFFQILEELTSLSILYRLIKMMNRQEIKVNGVRKWYYRYVYDYKN